MPRYIDADWIVQKIEGWQDQLAATYGPNDEYVLCLGEVLMKLDDTPTVDVVERKKGKWIRKSPTAWMWTCSCCKKDDAYAYSAGESCEPDVLQDLFCPNCGADMRGEDNADQV